LCGLDGLYSIKFYSRVCAEGSYGALQILQLPTEVNYLIYWMLT